MTYRNLDTTAAFSQLLNLEPANLVDLLKPERVTSSQVEAGASLTYNWAAMPVTEEHLKLLQELADEMSLVDKFRQLADGAVMNTGEKRQVLHHLARGQLGKSVMVDGEDKRAFYLGELEKIRAFSEKVRNGQIVGSTGKRFTDVVQIGIGGSDLGPRALYLALQGWAAEANIPTLRGHFISNVDPDDAAAVLADLDLESTLFILVSKSGTTLETLTNRDLVIQAMQGANIKGLDPASHIVAV